MNQITQGYLECAIWADLPEEEEFDGTIYDFSAESQIKAWNDIMVFCAELQDKKLFDSLLEVSDLDQIGHDFWLTRNGHGTGFWDRNYGELGEKVSEVARKFGECHVFVNNNKLELE